MKRMNVEYRLAWISVKNETLAAEEKVFPILDVYQPVDSSIPPESVTQTSQSAAVAETYCKWFLGKP